MTFGSRMCIDWNIGAEENVYHLVMQCSYQYECRVNMYRVLSEIPNRVGTEALKDPSKILLILLGKSVEDYVIKQMIPIWIISAKYISAMYREVIRKRKEYEL